jgi:hypothetical protein
MTSIDRAQPHGASGQFETIEFGKGHTEQVERTRTVDTDVAPEKFAVEAKQDQFGARSKIDPQEIALVKKLDRTILVRSPHRFLGHPR